MHFFKVSTKSLWKNYPDFVISCFTVIYIVVAIKMQTQFIYSNVFGVITVKKCTPCILRQVFYTRQMNKKRGTFINRICLLKI
jgi:predicted membrane protein